MKSKNSVAVAIKFFKSICLKPPFAAFATFTAKDCVESGSFATHRGRAINAGLIVELARGRSINTGPGHDSSVLSLTKGTLDGNVAFSGNRWR